MLSTPITANISNNNILISDNKQVKKYVKSLNADSCVERALKLYFVTNSTGNVLLIELCRYYLWGLLTVTAISVLVRIVHSLH